VDVVAIGEAVGACAKELIESAREQIQTIINLFIVVVDRSDAFNTLFGFNYFESATEVG
jgi:hypothetical protein